MGTYPPQMPQQIPPPPDPFKASYPQYKAPRRRGLPTWATVLIIVVVVLLGGCGAFVYFISSTLGFNTSNMLSGGSPLTPPAKVHVGTQLAWRDIMPPSSGLMSMSGPQSISFTGIAIADIDGDGADEVVVSNSYEQDYDIYELDCTNAAQPVTGQGMLADNGWDYDGDGTEDLLFNQYNSNQVEIYNATKLLTTMPGEVGMMHTTIADFDGDGQGDLVLDDSQTPGNGSVSVYTVNGVKLWQHTAGANMYNPACGDIDGDGAAELIFWDQNQSLVATDINGQQATYPAWGSYHWPTTCLDLDGDGVDEVFASNHGYQNVVTGAYTQLIYPLPGNSDSDDPMEKVYRADLDRDGVPELVTIGIDNYSTNSGLFFFDLAGNCTYYEEMGDPVEQFFVVTDENNDDFLVLRTDRRLLIYP